MSVVQPEDPAVQPEDPKTPNRGLAALNPEQTEAIDLCSPDGEPVEVMVNQLPIASGETTETDENWVEHHDTLTMELEAEQLLHSALII